MTPGAAGDGVGTRRDRKPAPRTVAGHHRVRRGPDYDGRSAEAVCSNFPWQARQWWWLSSLWQKRETLPSSSKVQM